MVCGRAGVGLFMVDKSKSMEILLDQVSLSVFIALLISTVTTLYIVCRLRKRKTKPVVTSFQTQQTSAGMGNLCCTDSTIASPDQASPKFAARANGQVASEPVVAKTTQPRPAFHNSSTNNGTTVVNGSSPSKQNSKPPSRQNSNSKVITIRTVTSTSKVDVPSSKISTTSVDTNSTVRSGANKRDSIDNVQNNIEDDSNGDQYSFPPVLEDFNLMDCDVDPTVLEDVFADDKLREIKFHLDADGPPMGFTIVGGADSEHGDLPIVVKRVSPDGLAHHEGQLRVGDEVIAVNDTVLYGQTQDFATHAFKSLEPGLVRLLVLQDPE